MIIVLRPSWFVFLLLLISSGTQAAVGTRIICQSAELCEETYERTIDYDGAWPRGHGGVLDSVLQHTFAFLTSGTLPAGVFPRRVDLYIHRGRLPDNASATMSGIRPGIMVSFPEAFNQTQVLQWASIWDPRASDIPTGRFLAIRHPYVPKAGGALPTWATTPGMRLVYSLYEAGVVARATSILRELRDSLRSLNADLGLPQLRKGVVDHAKLSLILQSDEGATGSDKKKLLTVETRSVFSNGNIDPGLLAAAHAPPSSDTPSTTVEVIGRSFAGSGQHRQLVTELVIRRSPDARSTSSHSEQEDSHYDIDLLEVFPPEVFVDADEIHRHEQLARPFHVMGYTPLSFMDIEIPAYLASSSAFVHRYRIKASEVNTPFSVSIPIHIRYGAPCPLPEQGITAVSVCAPDYAYRTFQFTVPITVAMERDFPVMTLLKTPISFSAMHPVGNLHHVPVVAAGTATALIGSAVYLIWKARHVKD